MHALVNRFPLLDHLYANSEASIDGHFWASAAGVSDYVHKNWFQNYGGRGRPYDFTYSVTWPGNGSSSTRPSATPSATSTTARPSRESCPSRTRTAAPLTLSRRAEVPALRPRAGHEDRSWRGAGGGVLSQ